HHELEAHGSPKRGNKERLVGFDLTDSTGAAGITWGSGAAFPSTASWSEFEPALEQCGRPGGARVIRLPRPSSRPAARNPPSRAVAGLLHDARGMIASDKRGDRVRLVTVEPDENGNYQIASSPVDDVGITPEDEPEQAAVGDG